MVCRGCKRDYPDEDGLLGVSKSAGVVDCETKEPIDLACYTCIDKVPKPQPAEPATQAA